MKTLQSFWNGKRRKKATANPGTYVQKCAPQIFQENEHYYYYCNRAGNFNPRGKGEQGLKSQGSSKIISHCSAHIKAIKNIKTNEVTVQYTCTH